jgi:hypothetical protein
MLNFPMPLMYINIKYFYAKCDPGKLAINDDEKLIRRRDSAGEIYANELGQG